MLKRSLIQGFIVFFLPWLVIGNVLANNGWNPEIALIVDYCLGFLLFFLVCRIYFIFPNIISSKINTLLFIPLGTGALVIRIGIFMLTILNKKGDPLDQGVLFLIIGVVLGITVFIFNLLRIAKE